MNGGPKRSKLGRVYFSADEPSLFPLPEPQAPEPEVLAVKTPL